MTRFAVPRPFPVIATLLTLTGVATLGSLGHWQQERLAWKTALQANLDAEFSKKAAATELTAADLNLKESSDVKRGVLKGKLDFAHQISLAGQIVDGKPVYHHLVPLLLKSGETVFVVVGYSSVPDSLSTPSTRAKTDQVSGTARLPQWNRFTPPNNPATNTWFRADPAEMAAALGLKNPTPALVYAEWHGYKLDGMPFVPVEHKLRNEHFNYMIFWYTMAVVLALIYILRFWRAPKPSQ
jgi:surfeit locus 1 family protein